MASPYYFLAEKLRKTMKDMGNKDDLMFRVVVTRSEVDMRNIKVVFGQRNEWSSRM